MAKLGRNRGMLFGSWTGSAITETAVSDITGCTGVTAAEVVASTFGTTVGQTGEYAFVYNSTDTNWKLNGTTVTLTSYGITVTGTPANGDTVVIHYTAASGGWEALGKDDDDLSKELNPDTETSKNVLGETTFTHAGYAPEIDMDKYYMDPSRIMYDHLLDVALTEKYAETDLLGYVAEAFFTSVDEEERTMSGYCYVRRAWFTPQSVGGDTSGFSIPFTITPIGGMTKKAITYDMATNVATTSDLD